MKKSSKIAELDSGFSPGIVLNFEEPVETVDQDKLQLMDELDNDWVEAWRREMRKTKMIDEHRSQPKAF